MIEEEVITQASFVNPFQSTEHGIVVKYTNDPDDGGTFIIRNVVDPSGLETGDDVRGVLYEEAKEIAELYDENGKMLPDQVEVFGYLDSVGTFSNNTYQNYIMLLEMGFDQLHGELSIMGIRARLDGGTRTINYKEDIYPLVKSEGVKSFLAWYFGEDDALSKPSVISSVKSFIEDLNSTRDIWPEHMKSAVDHYIGLLKLRFFNEEYPKFFKDATGKVLPKPVEKTNTGEISGPFGPM